MPHRHSASPCDTECILPDNAAWCCIRFLDSFIPSGWNMSILPDIVFYKHGQLTFRWILWSDLKRYTNLHSVHIRFKCTHSNQASLMIYPGMLTLYQLRWTEKAHTTLWCTSNTIIPLSFHFYATMVVNVASTTLSRPQDILLGFSVFEKHAMNTKKYWLPVGGRSLISEQTLPVMGTWERSWLSAGFWPATRGTLTMKFISFKVPVTEPNINWMRRQSRDGNYILIKCINIVT